jgi:hypothetical protein
LPSRAANKGGDPIAAYSYYDRRNKLLLLLMALWGLTGVKAFFAHASYGEHE